jgi:hypothetical protein
MLPGSLYSISNYQEKIPDNFSADAAAELFSIQSQKFQNSLDYQFIANFQKQNRFLNNDFTDLLGLTTTFNSFYNPYLTSNNKLYNYQSIMQNSSDLNFYNYNINDYNNNVIPTNNNNNSSMLTSLADMTNDLKNLSNKIFLNESNGLTTDHYSSLQTDDENLTSKRNNSNYKDTNFKIDIVLDEDEEYDVEDDDDLEYYFENENYTDYDDLNYNNFRISQIKKKQENKENYLNMNVNKLDDDEDDEYDENYDPIDEVMLKAYEEEENLVLEIEKVQNKELLSVIAQEAKLTRQLSAEKLMHFNHFNKYKNAELKKENKIKKSNDFETYEIKEKKRQRKFDNSLWLSYKDEDQYSDKCNTEIESEVDSNRTFGRLNLHAKLLSMSRKASPNERRRRHEEKQARAQEKREKFYLDRSKKLRELTKKIEEVRELKKKLIKVKKATMKAKLQRAEEKRQYLLRLKANKAAVEEQKAHEIAFINNLVAQNRKHDILERYEKRHEAIKHNLEEERQRKQEEQKAKEQAAELRRKELETQRMTKLREMLEKRRIKQSKIEKTQLEKEKERIEAAKAKEKTREMRLAYIEAQFQANKLEVKKRIIQKHEEWSKRHESNLEEIRKKAFEMSILHFSSEDQTGDAPTPVPYEKVKYCNHCHVIIKSEVQLKSHLRGIKHQQTMNEKNQGKNLTKSEIEEFNLNCIIDFPKETNEKEMIITEERKKAMKKRTKKLRTRIFSKGVEYESIKKKLSNETQINNNNKSKVPKLLKDLEKYSILNDSKQSNLDKICCEINRIISKNVNEQIIFKNFNGLSICVKLLEQICQISNYVQTSSKTIINIVNLLINICKNDYEICFELIMSNKVLSLLDLLNIHSNVMLNEILSNSNENNTTLNYKNNYTNQKYLGDWIICSSLFQLIGCVYSIISYEIQLFDKKTNDINQNINLINRANDLLGFEKL